MSKYKDPDVELAQMIKIQKDRQLLVVLQSAPPRNCLSVHFKIVLLTVQNEVQVLQLRKEGIYEYQLAGLLPHKLVCSGDLDYWGEIRGIWENLIMSGRYSEAINNWRQDTYQLSDRVESMLYCFRQRIKAAHYKMENNIPGNSWIKLMGMDRKVVLDQILDKFVEDTRMVVDLMDQMILLLANLLPALIKKNIKGIDVQEIMCEINRNLTNMFTL